MSSFPLRHILSIICVTEVLQAFDHFQETSDENLLLCTLCLSMTLLFQENLTAEEKPLHVIILSGQSNMAGMNPKLGLEPEIEKLFPEAEVIYFKVAKGGQPIRFWVSQWNDIAKKHGLKTLLTGSPQEKNYYQQILKSYEAQVGERKPASVTFCWMQGERDAKEKLHSAYKEALGTLISNLRKDLQQPEMNFVIGRLSDFGKQGYKEWQHVREVQVQLAQEDKHGAWVDCDDLNNKKGKDDLHYTQEGYKLLGQRYIRQARALIDGKQPDETGRLNERLTQPQQQQGGQDKHHCAKTPDNQILFEAET